MTFNRKGYHFAEMPAGYTNIRPKENYTENSERQHICALFPDAGGRITVLREVTRVLLRGVKARGNIPFVIKENGKLIDRGTVTVRNSRRVKVSRQGDKINCRVEITLRGYLIDHRAGTSLLNNDLMIKRIQASTAADMKRDCEAFITHMQEDYKIDCIDVTRFVLAKWRKEYENQADKDLIQKMNVSVQVKVKLEDYGESS